MKTCSVLFLSLVWLSIALAQPPDTLWTHSFPGRCYSAVEATDGGYALAGYTNSYGAGAWDFWLVKTGANGDSLWSRTYGGSNNEACHSVGQTTDGGFILAGDREISWNEYDFWVVKTDAEGDSLWSKSLGGPSHDHCWSAQQTIDGGYILLGYTYSFGAGSSDFWLVKLSANGDSLWSRTFGGSGSEEGACVQQTSDGGFILAGNTTSAGAGNLDFWLVKTDASGNSQ